MASKDEEGVEQREESFSAPSTPPRSVDPPNGRRTTTVDSPSTHIANPPQKPLPNYLKPTISSSHHTTCNYPKTQQQNSEASRLTSKTSVNRVLPPHKLGISKEPNSEKASKAPPPPNGEAAPPPPPPLKKARIPPLSIKKSGEAKPGDAQDHAKVMVAAGVLRSTSLKSRSGEGKRSKASEETGLEGAAKKIRTRVKSMSMSSIDVAAGPRKLDLRLGGKTLAGREGKEKGAGERLMSKKRVGKAAAAAGAAEEEGKARKEAPPGRGEEPANELPARRIKVKAMVGAFETAISSREAEGQPSQQNEEVAMAAVNGGGDAGDGGDGQHGQPPAAVGQPDQQGEEEESKDGPWEGEVESPTKMLTEST